MKINYPVLSVNSLKFILIGIFLLVFTSNSSAQCWSQVWSDEFDGTSLDLTKWDYELGTGCPGLCGFGNNEQESYTNSTNNVSVAGGSLSITAKYQAGVGGTGYDFTSGKIQTRSTNFDWLYGKFEARMKLPQGTGLWPAFWMLPKANAYGGWPTSGEIDIMENRGDQTTTIGGTLHYGNPSPNNKYDATPYSLSTGSFTSSFHLFTVEWEPGEIRWYVDSVLYKTETQTPNSLNPASNNAVVWPWDKNFYLILNLAVGGWYTGNPSSSAITGGDVNYSRTMEVDYVRVYTDVSAGGFSGGGIAGNTSVLQNEQGVAYSIPASASATYTWTVTGGTIASGQGTEAITVDWASTDGNVSLAKVLSCGTGNYTLPVTVQPTYCGVVIEDFENIRTTYPFINGVFSEKVNNPGSNVQNTSSYCSKYVRNSSEQYDVLQLATSLLGNADDYEKKIKSFMMDVYSNASGRAVQLVLESSATNGGAYPAGRHSTYTATTTVANAWETLEFTYVNSPDAACVGTTVDRISILFTPNTYTNTTFYWDNLLSSSKPKTSAITGSATVCNNQASVTYSLTNTTGSSYAWTVPSGAVINSGATGPNNNSINVTFATSSGNVAAIETNTSGCSGVEVTKAVTVNTCLANNKAILQSINIFPNPAAGELHINLNEGMEGNVKISVLDPLGREVQHQEIDNQVGEIIFNVSTLLPNMYILEIRKNEKIGRVSFFKN